MINGSSLFGQIVSGLFSTVWILWSLRACSDSDGAISPAELSRLSGEEATLSGKRRFFATRQPPGPSSFSSTPCPESGSCARCGLSCPRWHRRQLPPRLRVPFFRSKLGAEGGISMFFSRMFLSCWYDGDDVLEAMMLQARSSRRGPNFSRRLSTPKQER